MDLKNRKGLKDQAQKLVDRCDNQPRKLTWINSAVYLGLSLVISLITLALNHGIAGTGGLSGIQTRNILQTIQSMLNLVYTIAQPFWLVGLAYVYMQTVRKQMPQTQSLLRGFHRFGPVLRLNLLKWLLLFMVAFPCAFISSYAGMMLSPKMYTLFEPLALEMQQNPNADIYAMMAQIPVKELLGATWPMLILFTVMYLGAVIFFAYRFQFADYLILDDPKLGAIQALKNSFHMTKGIFKDLVMLDLSFLWYHALQAFATLFAFADLFLTYSGISLPISQDVASIISFCIYAALVLAMDYTIRPRVEATYALVYDRRRNQIYFPYTLDEN